MEATEARHNVRVPTLSPCQSDSSSFPSPLCRNIFHNNFWTRPGVDKVKPKVWFSTPYRLVVVGGGP